MKYYVSRKRKLRTIEPLGKEVYMKDVQELKVTIVYQLFERKFLKGSRQGGSNPIGKMMKKEIAID